MGRVKRIKREEWQKKPKNWTSVKKLNMGITVFSRGVCF